MHICRSFCLGSSYFLFITCQYIAYYYVGYYTGDFGKLISSKCMSFAYSGSDSFLLSRYLHTIPFFLVMALFVMQSLHILNSNGDNLQPYLTPFCILIFSLRCPLSKIWQGAALYIIKISSRILWGIYSVTYTLKYFHKICKYLEFSSLPVVPFI